MFVVLHGNHSGMAVASATCLAYQATRVRDVPREFPCGTDHAEPVTRRPLLRRHRRSSIVSM